MLVTTRAAPRELTDDRALWLHLDAGPAPRCWLAASADRFSRAAAERMAAHVGAALTVAADLADAPLAALPLEPPDEQRRELTAWNQTTRELAHARALVHETIVEQARQTPGAIAVVSGESSLTYAALERRTAALARRLRALGAGPEVPIGVCCHRSLDGVIAFLAVLRAGAVYVPLDPAYPAERLAMMLTSAGARLVLLGRGCDAQLPANVATLALADVPGGGPDEMGEMDDRDDSDRSAANEAAPDPPPALAPAPPLDPDNLAYVMYTSGSSGAPKGVMISHAALRNTLAWMQEAYPLRPTEVVAHKTSISFTDSIWELLWPLLVGASLVVIEENEARFPRLLAGALERHRVTVTQFVPAQMRLFLDEIERGRRAGALPDLRLVFNGGERLPEALAGDWLRWFPATCIANAYGMTESAIYGTNFVVRASDSVPVEAPVVLPVEAPVDAPVALPVVLIGRPIANERAYVLDADGDPCPPLCLGEIYLAGDSLSRGYQGRPELTAERFLPDPFGPPGARMYRTGDLGRRLPDGQLTCVGRADRQVKVRGARVELGEVEAALTRHPAIRQAAVLARRAGDDHRLTAYYTVRATDPGARELHAFLLCTLPAYMVPSSFVALAELPLTVNGKVDRARLECAPPAQD